jgi:FKBP-type peptidyl-prolyl cis-trans isomerase
VWCESTGRVVPHNGVAALIRGLQEALLLMKPGAKWEIYIQPREGFPQAAFSRNQAPRLCAGVTAAKQRNNVAIAIHVSLTVVLLDVILTLAFGRANTIQQCARHAVVPLLLAGERLVGTAVSSSKVQCSEFFIAAHERTNSI